MRSRNPRVANGGRRRKLRAQVLAEESVCWLCNQPVDFDLRYPDPWSASVDEIVPVDPKFGGSPYDRDNCRLAHLRCNQSRGNGVRRQRPVVVPYRSMREW